jgi:hypothetical protein
LKAGGKQSTLCRDAEYEYCVFKMPVETFLAADSDLEERT